MKYYFRRFRKYRAPSVGHTPNLTGQRDPGWDRYPNVLLPQDREDLTEF